ncbi:TRAP transporter small permease [Neobacillus mesonae]|uniref:TRAP transporter small permease n=1 Tax=Neobacillus mesonae TaxID=1193713 RepID=UPI00203A7935|nr:TRAP transporter small permease [Neobacillus mesonae]MCM3566944.1 TRAP transporter small permease [Neobacillus mesonae]
MKKFNSIMEGLTGFLLIVMTILAITQVITRYVLEVSVPWVEELIRYLMVFTIFIGSSIAIYQKAHLSVEIFDLVLNKKQFRYLDLTRQLIITLFSVVMVYITFEFIKTLLDSGQLSPAMHISMGWPMASLLLGSLLMVINGGFLFYRILSKKEIIKEGDPM